jgi:hypothetical protein
MIATLDIEEVDDADLEPYRECDVKNCDRPATWHLQQHTCGAGIYCTACYKRWLNEVRACLSEYGYVRCGYCNKHFPTVDAIATIRPI